MSTPREQDDQLLTITRWTARAMSLLLFALWGAFFLEHLSWFIGAPQQPPLAIWFLQGLHLCMLVGLLCALKWEIPGSLLVAVSALLFLAQAAARNFPWFYFITIMPALLYGFCWWRERRHVPPDLRKKAV